MPHTPAAPPAEPRARHVSVLATGAHLPGEALDNDALARFCGPLPADVLDGIQVKRRHWMVDPPPAPTPPAPRRWPPPPPARPSSGPASRPARST
ncbi:hypothetical protein O1M63_06800 [Streptomyces mirabilis]|nr:hypothetical protein [Streptomyces mirabilis]